MEKSRILPKTFHHNFDINDINNSQNSNNSITPNGNNDNINNINQNNNINNINNLKNITYSSNNINEDIKNNSINPQSEKTNGKNHKKLNIIFNNNSDESVNNSLVDMSEEEKARLEKQILLIEDVHDSQIHDSENSQQEDDNKITISFFFRDEIEKKSLTINKDKKYSEVLNEFYQKYNIILQKEPISIHKTRVIDNDKTLIENNIRNGDEIILFLPPKKQNPNIEDDDRELYQLFLKEYQAKKSGEYQRELDKARIENKPRPEFESKINLGDFIKFLIERTKIKSSGIEVIEHQHNLVCCITNYNWKCNQCCKDYDCQEEKFCCTDCQYYMCQNCRKFKGYERRKAIKKDITSENEKFRNKYIVLKDIHDHKLMYCLTSREYFKETCWMCDSCGKIGNNWDFYCSVCDFDLCMDCYNERKTKDQ